MSMGNANLVWHAATVSRKRRELSNGHRACVLWFTGLSGAGKSTLSHATEEVLHQRGCSTFVLDGDNVRHGLCSDLGFGLPDRSENIRRIAETSKLMVEAGLIVLAAFISPVESDRQRARSLFPHGDFFEIYCRASLEICEQRDVKGHYRRARSGEIPDFTGISSPYEAPSMPDLTIDTEKFDVTQGANMILDFMAARRIFTTD